MSITSIDVVDNGDIVDDRSVSHIIIADIDAGNMLSGAENPITCRRTIRAECNANVYPRTDRRPAIIPTILAPGDPGRRPIVSRHPYPSIGVVVEPAAIMESGPTPAIVGDPGPSIFRIHPMATGAIRAETSADSRHPDIAVIRIADPGAERA